MFKYNKSYLNKSAMKANYTFVCIITRHLLKIIYLLMTQKYNLCIFLFPYFFITVKE